MIDVVEKKNKSYPIAYIVAMGAGLESFIYRELETMYAKGFRSTYLQQNM